MKKLSGSELRQLWLDFFQKRGHYVLESISLVPVNDDSLLWINAGVATLKQYFTGQKIPLCRRLTNSQRCLRTNDIENVGVTSRHLTFFEMLGNFSVGDYFKEEAIKFAYELVFGELKMPLEKIYITIFEGDDQAYKFWKSHGISDEHIIKCVRDRNFWDLGQGPCGPCTEIYYDRGEKYDPDHLGIKLLHDDIENDRYIEIWNIVFSEFNNDGHGNYTNLISKNIDTGAGFERLLSIIQDVPTNFDTDLFAPLIKTIGKHTDAKYVIDDYFSNDPQKHKVQQSFRIIADHFRSVVFALADGVVPSNKDRGYILRKLMRRLIVYAHKLKLNLSETLGDLLDALVDKYKDFYPYLVDQKKPILQILQFEINGFDKVLSSGLAMMEKQLQKPAGFDGHFVFKLVETYGIPLEVIREFCQQNDIEFASIEKDFNGFFAQHQKLSRTLNAKAMAQQHKELLELKVASDFVRHENNIDGTCVALFDQDFKEVNELNGDGYAVFSKTPFYATSGGQQHDVGWIKFNKEVVGEVIDVFKGPNLQHIHQLTLAKNIKLNEKYCLVYDESIRQGMKRNHTAEHLLQGALQRLFSPSIKQEGAFKSAEKATFDFTYEKKLSDDDLEKLEHEILRIIDLNVKVTTSLVSLEEAKAMNALAYFEDRYAKFKQDKLRMVKMGEFSTELCGGTHTESTGEMEDFFVTSCNAHGRNKWRIEVITGKDNVQKYLNNECQKHFETLKDLRQKLSQLTNSSFQSSAKALSDNLDRLVFPTSVHKLRHFAKQLNQYEDQINQLDLLFQKQTEQKQSDELAKDIAAAITQNNYVIYTGENLSPNLISLALKNLISQHCDLVFAVINNQPDQNSLQYYVACSEPLSKKYNCCNIVKSVSQAHHGNGGGKPNFAQGGVRGSQPTKAVIASFEALLKKCAS